MLRVKNVETAEILTNQLGEINLISATQASSATDTNDPRDFAEFGSKNEDRLTSERAPTLAPNDLMTLPKGQAFALIEGGQLWKIRLPLIDSTDDIMIPDDLAQCAAQMKRQYASMAPSDEPLVGERLAA